jgi:hypothetical protein
MKDTISKQKTDIMNKVNMLSWINPEDTAAFWQMAQAWTPAPTGWPAAPAGWPQALPAPAAPLTPNASQVWWPQNMMAW